MITAKIATKPNILLVFDMPQSKAWINQGTTTPDGIAAFLQRFMHAGISLPEEVSAVCLADTLGAKSADYKAKQPYITELIETHAFNLIIPVGAKAFEMLAGFKGVERYFGKPILSEIYKCKILACPNPAMVKYKPEIKEVLEETVKVAAFEKDFSNLIQAAKAAVDYTIIDTTAKFEELMGHLLVEKVIAFDLESTGFNHNYHEILTAQFTYRAGQSALIPSQFYKNTDGTPKFWTDAQWSEITRRLRTVFMRRDVLLLGHNIKFDLKFINFWWGVPIPKARNIHDTMIMSFLVNENTANDLKSLACIMTDLGDYEFELERWKKEYCKKNKIKISDFSYGYIPFDIIAPYALTDTDATFRIWLLLKEQVKEEGQVDVFKMLMRFTYTTCHMELRGWPVDLEYAHKYLKELEAKIVIAEADLLKEPVIKQAEKILGVLELQKINAKRKNKIAALPVPFQFNIRSTAQKSLLFFDVMGLPKIKFTKARDADGKRTNPSTDKEVMEQWSFDVPKVAPFLEKIKQCAELCKMKSTYVEGIIKKTVNGRIHPSYNVIGAKTGRLSSRNPNFQNLPVRNSEAKNVKRIIKARPGYILIGADLSAAEMRWACVCSGDTKLIQIFNAGVDIHGAIACEVFGLDCDPNEVKYKYPELRDISKTIQFLSLYGGGADTLATKVKIKPKRAKAILEQIMQELGLVAQVGTKLDEKSGKDTPIWGDYDFAKLENNAGAVARMADMFKFPVWKAEAVLGARDKANALMSAFEIDRDAAQVILDSYFTKYAGVSQYIRDTEAFSRKNGYSLSLLGRKRRVPEITSDDNGIAERGTRQAVNATIQSIASDGLMLSACNLQDDILDSGESPILMLGAIHDALYFEVREDYAKEAHDIIIKYMSTFPIESPIPMKADAEWGRDWAHFSEEFEDLYAELREEEEDEDEAFDEAA